MAKGSTNKQRDLKAVKASRNNTKGSRTRATSTTTTIVKASNGFVFSPPTAKPSTSTSSTPSSSNSIIQWKDITIIGEKLENIFRLHDQPWDFSHLDDAILKIQNDNPGRGIYLAAGSQPYSYEPDTCPYILVLVMQEGYEPPPYVALQDFQNGTDDVRHMRSYNLTWSNPIITTSAPNNNAGKVFMLKSTRRPAVMKRMSTEDLMANEYLALWTMKPAIEWQKKANGDVKVERAKFSYDITGDGDVVHEMFDKEVGDCLAEFIPDFCDRHELNESDHSESIKTAIRTAFATERNKINQHITLLQQKENYPEDVLDDIKIIKIFPQNNCIQAKNTYVNKFYGRACLVL